MEINNNCVPLLRFPGFVGEWEMFTMEDLFEIRNGYTPSKYNPEFWEGGTIPWFRMEDIRQNGHILSDSIQHVTPAAVKGAGLFPAYSIIVATTATIGEHALIIADSLANQQFTFLTKRKSHDNKLDMLYFHQYMFIIDEWCKKNTNAGGLLSVNMQAFKKLSIPLPSLEEQNEIVECLEAEDRMIAAQEQKVESLKTHKKGLMQQLFPQPGATTPTLRFPGFTGEWTQYKLGECFDERNEQSPESSDYPLMAFIAGKGVAAKGEKYDRSALVKDASNKKYKRTELGDFIYSSNNLESGSIGLNRYGKACISPVYSIFKAKKGFDPYFIGAILTRKSFISEMIKYRQGVVYGQWKIPEKEFLNLIIRIPSFAEQQKIAEFLEAEDRLISAQEQIVESLKTHKKGLMQQLFPQPVK